MSATGKKGDVRGQRVVGTGQYIYIYLEKKKRVGSQATKRT